jgi:hypothetical protein
VINGIAATAAPGVCGVAQLNAISFDSLRALHSDASSDPSFTMYNGGGTTESTSEVSAEVLAWDSEFTLRGRWSRAGLLDTSTNQFGGIFVSGEIGDWGNEFDYDQVATWTDDPLVPIVELKLGAVTSTSNRLSALITRATVRTPHKQLRYAIPAA